MNQQFPLLLVFFTNTSPQFPPRLSPLSAGLGGNQGTNADVQI